MLGVENLLVVASSFSKTVKATVRTGGFTTFGRQKNRHDAVTFQRGYETALTAAIR